MLGREIVEFRTFIAVVEKVAGLKGGIERTGGLDPLGAAALDADRVQVEATGAILRRRRDAFGREVEDGAVAE